MDHAPLGRSGLMVSRLAYGNALTHGEQLDDRTSFACVRAALDAGITTFDTADAYAGGRAEELLCRALAGHRREDLVLCTKVGRSKRDDPNAGRLSRKHIVESLHGSLGRLGTDHIDLYQAHRFDPETPLEETMLAFASLVNAGKVLYVGVSEWPADRIRAAAALAKELGVPLIASQPQYSLLWRVIEAEVVPTCVELGIGQLVWSPLAGGVLTGKYAPGVPAPENSRAARSPIGAQSINRWNYLDDAVLTAVGAVARLAAEAGLSLPRLAIAWVLRNPAVSGALLGASRPEHLRDNVEALSVRLDDDFVKLVEEAVEPVVRRDPVLTRDPLGPAARFR
ncbi:aldo/keto reductase family protein [Amycolatopsis samaneae]|uniref:Aldo/keto reductase family protein n=1 Tax=Amycolatopsis samaneae TaxID=664691 RepID=A0ABW5GRN6_9PSEU